MESAVPITVVSAALGSGVLAAALLYLSCAERAHPALRWWTAAFVINTLRYSLMLLAPQLGPALGTFLQEATAVGYAALLLAGSFLYFGRAIPRVSLAGAVAALMGWVAAGAWLELPFVARMLPICLMLGGAMISIGIAFLRVRGEYRVENRIVGACFAIWGLHIFNFPFLRNVAWFAPYGFLLSQILSTAIALGLIIITQRHQQSATRHATRRAELSEEQQMASEQRFRAFAEASSDWFWEMGPDLRFTYMSERLRHALGTDPSYMIGKHREELADTSLEPERWRQHFADLAAHRPFREFTYKLALPDRKTRHITVSGQPMFATDGEFLGYRGTGRDVTAEIAREQKIQHQAALLQALIENLPIGVSQVDAQKNVVAFNHVFLDLLQFPADRFRPGDSFETFIAHLGERRGLQGAELDAYIRARLDLAETRKPHHFEETTPDGRIIDVRGTPLPDGGFVSLYSDVTERRQSEAELKATEAQLRDFAESTADWFWERDAEHRFTYVSPSIYEAVGMRPEAMIGRTLFEKAPENMTEAQWAEHIDLFKSLRAYRDVRIARRDSDGKLRYFSVSGRPVLDADGRATGYRGTGRDVTDEVQAEARANEAQKQLAGAIGSLTDAFALFDADDRLVTCNDAYRRISDPIQDLLIPGATFESLLRAGFAAGRYPDAGTDIESFVRWRMQHHRNPETVLQRQILDGTWIQVRENRLSDGGTAIIATDISELKAQEGELREKSDLLQATLENMGEGIGVWSADLRLISRNARYCELMGVPDSLCAPGVHLREILMWEATSGLLGFKDPIAEVERRLVESSRPEHGRSARWRTSGRYVELRRSPMPGGGFVTLLTDATVLKQAEERFKDFAEASSDWFWEQDAELRFTFLTPGIYDKAGLTPESFIGKTRRETRPLGVSDTQWNQHLAQLDARQPFRDFRLQRIDPQGRPRHLAISGKPVFDAAGRFAGYRGSGRDITDLMEADARANLAQSRLAGALEGLSDGLALFDRDDILLMCNESYRAMLGEVGRTLQPGMTFEQILRANIAHGIVPCPPDETEIWVSQRMALHRNPATPIEWQLASGRWIQIREQYLNDGGAVVILTDITATKERERELADKTELLQRTLENMGEGIDVYDKDMRLVAWNRRLLELLELPSQLTRVGTAFETMMRFLAERGDFGQVDVDEVVRQRIEQARGNQPYSFAGWRSSGRFLEVRRNPMPGGGFVTMVSDVTERKHAEEALEESRQMLRVVIDQVPARISVKDRDLRYILVNKAQADALGVSPQQAMGKKYADYYNQKFSEETWRDYMDDVDERDRRSLAGESILFHEETIKRRDGEFVSSLSSKIPLRDSTGDINAVLTIAIDITDRKRTENVLREAKEVAELANRTKTDFLANMSHELRTPLNAVIGFSEIIHKQMFGPIGSERYREYARDIYESGTHLLNLINDILDVSKAEAGKIELHEEIVKIDRIIDASVRLIQERARDANLELTMPETSSLPAVRADERRLKQVLLNLLSNAVKFTPAGGRVAIAANTTPDQGFSLQVSDTGIGIAEADIAKVLSPFGQVDSKLARKYEGTGLGLSLSKALVELHGGELTIDSTVGVGTTVTVTLPPERVVA